MADAKRQHYVPQCYLRNFATNEGKINVYDKEKMEVRTNQDILNIAMNNRFYDTNLFDIYKKAGLDEQEHIKKELEELLGTKNIEEALKDLDSCQYIEKKFFSERVEVFFDLLLKSIIKKSNNLSEWYIKNCFALSKNEKELLSFFIAIQIIRTKSFRDNIGSVLEQLCEAMVSKWQMSKKDDLPKNAFEVTVDKESVKLQHNGIVLDPEMALGFAKVLSNHIWIIYINKTNTPFYTSDNPVVKIPHKHDDFYSYEGLNSEGIEILFPISTNLLLGMYDANTYKNCFTDRNYIELYDEEYVKYCNSAQVVNSQRCVFSINNNFDIAEAICKEDPCVRNARRRLEIL